MKKKRYLKVPGLNTASTADISFIMLILFLITTSMDLDIGIDRQLQPKNKNENNKTYISSNKTIKFDITNENKIFMNQTLIKVDTLKSYIIKKLSNKSTQYVIIVNTDRKAKYNTYFKLQNQIVAAYNQIKNQYTLEHFGTYYSQCTNEQKEQTNKEIPQQISETYTVFK